MVRFESLHQGRAEGSRLAPRSATINTRSDTKTDGADRISLGPNYRGFIMGSCVLEVLTKIKVALSKTGSTFGQYLSKALIDVHSCFQCPFFAVISDDHLGV